MNGGPAKGTTFARNLWVGLSTNPSGSQAIADTNRFQAMDLVVEIQQADGVALGTIALAAEFLLVHEGGKRCDSS